ncbi:hypothetical protein VNO77_34142 [Canavalia gladiata]|uniref:Uncharacterized protein n=1 Tax=Canavalia gladiata TaxID=3824 RepID=A0AAN9KDR5_CANGL
MSKQVTMALGGNSNSLHDMLVVLSVYSDNRISDVVLHSMARRRASSSGMRVAGEAKTKLQSCGLPDIRPALLRYCF